MRATTLVPVGETELEVAEWGRGEPVVFVQTALTADECEPLAEQPALAPYRRILYRRRGYGRSGPATGAGSIVRDAADCRALLAALRVGRAHLVGLSYSGAVVLQLAADAPGLVQTLTLLEPPPVRTPSAPDFRAVCERLIGIRRERGAPAALQEFLRVVPGAAFHGASPAERDVLTFFDADLPALLGWRFGAEDARRVGCPVLHVGGSDSGRFFAEMRELVRAWLPHAEDVVIQGADHALALTHAGEIGEVMAAFLRRHPSGTQPR